MEYHLERSGMILHDAVEINCRNGTSTENQCAGPNTQGPNTLAKWCMLEDGEGAI